jgi:Zn-finger nucleic acid-binding protein
MMEARTLVCPGCGAPARPADPRCAYCSAELALIACASCFGHVFAGMKHCPHCGEIAVGAEQLPVTGTRCPGCSKPLQPKKVGGVRLDECTACAGVWAERETFRDLCQKAEGRANFLRELPPQQHRLPIEPVRYRRCVVCRNLMHRVNFGRVSGVVVDVCKCHGIWFDRDELRRVMTFIHEGGLTVEREKRAADDDAQRVREEVRIEAAAGQPPALISIRREVVVYHGKAKPDQASTDLLSFVVSLFD